MEHIKHNSWMWRAANCNSGSFYGLWWGWENSLKALKFFHLLHSTKAARAFYCCICTSTAMLFGTSPKTAFNKYSKIYTIKWATEEKYEFELKRKKKKTGRKTISENSEWVSCNLLSDQNKFLWSNRTTQVATFMTINTLNRKILL